MTGCEALVGAALFACLARDPACVPLPPERGHLFPLVEATVRYESGFRPWAIRDEATRESLFPESRDAAVAEAVRRDAAGHTLGLGWGQITHRANWRLHTGLDGRAAIAALLDPCTNLRATTNHLLAAHDAAVAYNAGPRRIGSPPVASAAYALRVVASAAGLRAPPASTAARASTPSPPRIIAATGRGATGTAFAYATTR